MEDSNAGLDWSRRYLDHPHKRRRKTASHTLPTLLLLCSLLLFALPVARAAPQCLRFADSVTINQLFTDGGPGTKVLLCPNKVYRLSGTIVFTAADQELATFGYPTGPERATIRIESPKLATAIQGDCRRCARIAIRSLIVDGNRNELGRMVEHDPSGLIVIGGNEGQSIKQSKIFDPRGFTAVHVREGDKLSCAGAVIEKNEIGPVGNEYDPAVDGDDPEMSPIGRPLADGISIACRDSFVRDNTFIDNTAAAIVIYCSPGTLVHANHIYARQASMMGGILMVDSTPFDSDYSKMVVKSNIIHAESRTIRVGIGIGAAVWSDDIDMILKGGSVIGNGFKGKYMGYGIAAAGLNAWTIKDNWDEAVHQGKRSARCFDEPVNPDPMPFLYYGKTVTESDIQDGFVDQEFQYVVCIDGLEDSSNPPKPVVTTTTLDAALPELPTKAVEAAPAAATPELDLFSTGSEVMDDILEHSQQRMLEAFSHLSKRVDGLSIARRPIGRSPVGSNQGIITDVSAALTQLRQRIEDIEARQKYFVDTIEQFRLKIFERDVEVYELDRWQSDAIISIEEKLKHSPVANSRSEASKSGSEVKKSTKKSQMSAESTLGGVLGSVLQVLVVSVVFGLLCEVIKRYWSGRRTHRKVM